MGFVFVSRSVQGTPLVILQQYTNINIHLSIQTYHVQILIFIFLNLQYTYTNIYLSHTGRKKSYGRRAHENTHRTSYASLHTPRENLATLPSCTQTGLFCHTQASFVTHRPLLSYWDPCIPWVLPQLLLLLLIIIIIQQQLLLILILRETETHVYDVTKQKRPRESHVCRFCEI